MYTKPRIDENQFSCLSKKALKTVQQLQVSKDLNEHARRSHMVYPSLRESYLKQSQQAESPKPFSYPEKTVTNDSIDHPFVASSLFNERFKGTIRSSAGHRRSYKLIDKPIKMLVRD